MREQFISDIWAKRNAWADASRRFQDDTKRWRLAQLSLVILGSICATASATGVPFANPEDGIAVANIVLAATGAVALALVTFVQEQLLSVENVERWPRSRSVAEAIKSEIFRFQAGAKPYDDTGSDDALKDALKLLLDAVDAHEAQAEDLLPHLKIESGGRSAPGRLDHGAYLEQRLDEQARGFYQRRAQEHFRAARRLRVIVLVLSLLSAVSSALIAVGVAFGLGAWVAVVTTISLAVATYASLQRYEFQATSYAKLARRLRRLSKDWQIGAWSSWSDFVNECENTISTENRAWMAELIREKDTLADLPEPQQTQQ